MIFWTKFGQTGYFRSKTKKLTLLRVSMVVTYHIKLFRTGTDYTQLYCTQVGNIWNNWRFQVSILILGMLVKLRLSIKISTGFLKHFKNSYFGSSVAIILGPYWKHLRSPSKVSIFPHILWLSFVINHDFLFWYKMQASQRAVT